MNKQIKSSDKNQNKNQKRVKNLAKRRLSSYFAYMTSILIAAIMILTMSYVFNHIKNLAMEYDTNLKSFNYSLSSLLGETFEEAYSQDSTYKMTKMLNNLKARGMILYLYAVKTDNNRVFFTTMPEIMNENGVIAKGDIFLRYQGKEIMETSSGTKNYTLYIGMPVEKIALTHLNALLEKVKIFIAIFLFIGVFASAIMSRIVINPLDELTKGVKEFAKENFDFR